MSSARPLRAPGHGGVDFEERVDFGRLRRYRLDRSRAALEASDCGVFLTWEWLFTWWKHLSEDRRLSILTVRRGGELVDLRRHPTHNEHSVTRLPA